MERDMLDLDRIDELREEIGPDAFSEVVELFLDEVENALLRLGTAETLADDLHFLKGCALNLGFSTFAATVSEAERLARTGEGKRVNPAAIRAVFAESKQVFVDALCPQSAKNAAAG